MRYSKKYEEIRRYRSFFHIILLYWFHKSKGYSLRVKPSLDTRQKGLFATRDPRRPNQIGLSVIRLIRRKENFLFVKGIDVIDGTPLLGIKRMCLILSQ